MRIVSGIQCNVHFLFSLVMRKVVLACSALLIANGCHTPDDVSPYLDLAFIQLYGSNGSKEGIDMLQMSDGGFVMVGSSTSELSGSDISNKDMYVVRTDVHGNTLWENTFGGDGDEIGRSVILGPQSNSLYVCGESDELGSKDAFVVKISAESGFREDSTYYGAAGRDEIGTSMLNIDGGGFLITGTSGTDTSSFYMVETDVNLLAIDKRSNYVFGMKGVENISTLTLKQKQSNPLYPPYVCVGSVKAVSPDPNIPDKYKFQTFNYSANNDKAINPELYGDDQFNYICTGADNTLDGRLILSGTTDAGGYQKEMLVKLDSDRQPIWEHFYTNQFNAPVENVRVMQTQDGGFLVSSTIETGYPLYDEISLMRLDSGGTELWRQTYGSNDCDDVAGKVIELEDGSFMMVGTIGFFINSYSNMCLMKVNSSGTLVPTN